MVQEPRRPRAAKRSASKTAPGRASRTERSATEDIDYLVERERALMTPERGKPLDEACARLLALLRERCPGLVSNDAMPAGATAAPISVPLEEVSVLAGLAACQAAAEASWGRVPSDLERLPSAVVWQAGADALMVELTGMRLGTDEGMITVVIPVRCDQIPRGRGVVEIDFAVGTRERPTGLLAAAAEPRGPRVVVRVWREALIALAWQSLLDSAGGIAAAAGSDRDGSRLIPAAFTASRTEIGITAQARHEMDRIFPGRVVAPAPWGRQ